MARKRRSSGASSVSLFGVILPTRCPRLYLGTNADHSVGPKILQGLFTDIGNVTGDFLRAELGIARSDLKFIDVNGGIDVLLDDALGNEDRVLEIVSIPRHESDQHVASQRQLAMFGVWAVGDDISLVDVLSLEDDRLLVDASAGVRTHELAQFVNPDAGRGSVLIFFLPSGNDPSRVTMTWLPVTDATIPAPSERTTALES